jgi:hypothetical protein
MKTQRNTIRVAAAALLVVALSALGLASSASAKLVGNYAKFAQCPYSNLEVKKCLYSVTEGGVVVLGSKKVPIVNPAVLQGGYGAANEETGFAKFYGASNGITLSKAPQPVPGGLAGLVNCKEISNFLLRISCEVTFENGLTGVNSTLELAKPASDIKISELHLAQEEGVALSLPIKIRLENPFLGESCYVGSSSAPIIWELTTGFTNPPAPNTPIRGSAGDIEFLEEGRILVAKKAELDDNAWAAPAASGCGGLFSFLIDPIVNASSGLPSAAGKNTAILVNTANIASAAAVRKNNAENP